MNYPFTRIASLVLAFGFFISCNTLQSSQQAQTDSQPLSETQLEQKIDSLNQRISAGDSTAELLYQKGYYLSKLAQKKEQPRDRAPLYREVNTALQWSIDNDAATTGIPEQNSARELLTVSWSNEHNRGVEIMLSDSTLDSPEYRRAAAHFKNATIIIPDSAISYKMEARAHYKNQQPGKAIATLEKARSNISNVPPLLLEQLAYLYLQQEQPQQAINIYEKAESFSNQNLNLIHGLANAYISAGAHRKAITLLQRLVDEKPENIIYRQSLATELYYLASAKIDSLISNNNNGISQVSNSDFPSIDSLLKRAEGHFSQLVKQNPENKELKQRFAQFYHNSASNYQQLLPVVNSQPTATTVESRIVDFLNSSLPLFEELAERNPKQKTYWQNLYQAYSYLGMQEKAEQAKSNL